MKYRDMRRTEWRRILERQFCERAYIKDGSRVRESLMLIKKVTAPLAVGDGSGTVTIADNGYCWLQTAAEGEHVWLTSMFDQNGSLVQIYFDITAGNRFDDPENPTFEDLYLDVVVTPSGEICVLDENELEEALAAGEVTKEKYGQAKEACRRLCDWLEVNRFEAIEYCNETYCELTKNRIISC